MISFTDRVCLLLVFYSWNQLDVCIVILSIIGIVLEDIKSGFIPINPTIIRVMRVMRIARGLFFYTNISINFRLQTKKLLFYFFSGMDAQVMQFGFH